MLATDKDLVRNDVAGRADNSGMIGVLASTRKVGGRGVRINRMLQAARLDQIADHGLIIEVSMRVPIGLECGFDKGKWIVLQSRQPHQARGRSIRLAAGSADQCPGASHI